MRHAAHLGRFPVFLTLLLIVAVVFLPGRAEFVVRVYVLLLAAFVLAHLLARLRASLPERRTSPVDAALNRRPRLPCASPSSSGSSARSRSDSPRRSTSISACAPRSAGSRTSCSARAAGSTSTRIPRLRGVRSATRRGSSCASTASRRTTGFAKGIDLESLRHVVVSLETL